MQESVLSIKHLVSEAHCHETLRQLRWSGGVTCPHCDSGKTIRRGFDGPEKFLQRYACQSCGKRFDDLTGTALSGRHQPLSVWVLCLYFMGLNLSNAQIAQELDLNKGDVQTMAECLRNGIAQKKRQSSCRVSLSSMKRTSWLGTKANPIKSLRPGVLHAVAD